MLPYVSNGLLISCVRDDGSAIRVPCLSSIAAKIGSAGCALSPEGHEPLTACVWGWSCIQGQGFSVVKLAIDLMKLFCMSMGTGSGGMGARMGFFGVLQVSSRITAHDSRPVRLSCEGG